MPAKEFDAFTRLDASDVNAYLANRPLQNAIINGAFEINQRNFTSSTAGGYGFDRWQTFNSGGTVTSSSQAFTLGSAPIAGIEASNFYRVVIAGQSASGNGVQLLQGIESVRSFANQTVTISFYAKAETGTPKIGVELFQSFGSGGSPSANFSTPVASPTISTSWTRYTATILVPSIAGKTIGTANNDRLEVGFWFSAGSDFNSRASSIGIQNNTFDIWGIQVEAGPTANVFRRNANSLQAELAACQRYYYRYYPGAVGRPFGLSMVASTTQARASLVFPVTMRSRPSSFEQSGTAGDYRLLVGGGASITCTSVPALQDYTPFGAEVNFNASGLTSGQAALVQAVSASAFLGFGAEL
jgi:hypothetical protein